MTGKQPDVDPLRTFELTDEEWAEILGSVKTEGRQSWEEYAPTIVAAIELGYLDPHLHMLGKFLRERYQHLKVGAPAPAYYVPRQAPDAVGIAPVSLVLRDLPATLANEVGMNMIRPPGVTPTREAGPGDRNGSRTFVARGYMFRKPDFVGKYFESKLYGGSIVRIEKVNPQNFACTVIAAPDRPERVGHAVDYVIEKQFHLYNIKN